MHVTINGNRYGFRYVPNMHDRGQCDPPNVKAKEVRIASRLVGEEQLDITIHELLHAGCWYLDEETVANVATDIARTLWRLGYRRHSTEESNG